MKAFITGANSLIGVGIARQLLANGHKVVAFDLERSRLPAASEFLAGDVRDFEAVADAASDCDAGIHLAALSGDRTPADILSVNVIGAIGFMRAARLAGFSCSVIASSAPVHMQPSPADRNQLLRTGADADHPYDLSKALQEVAARDFHAHGLPCLGIRLGHVVDGSRGVTLREGRPLSNEQYCRGGWVAIEDVVSVFVESLALVPRVDEFEILNVIGSRAGHRRFDVARTEQRLGIRLAFDFAGFEPAH